MIRQRLEDAKQLKEILLRLGVRPAARYWTSPIHIFLGNMAGGAVAGAALSLLGALLLLVDARRGADSALYHTLHIIGTVIQTIRVQIANELR